MKTIKVSEKIEEMHRIENIYCFNMYKMFEISVEKYTDVGNRRLFWVRMHDVQEGLCVKNMADLVRKEINSWYF